MPTFIFSKMAQQQPRKAIYETKLHFMCLVILAALVFKAAEVIATKPPSNAKGCEEQWKTLLTTLDRNPQISDDARATQNAKGTTADTDGYVLITPKHSVTVKYFPDTHKGNEYPLWAFYVCNKEKGTLIHDHCRIGDSSETLRLKIPQGKYFFTNGEANDKLQRDGMGYSCRAGTASKSLAFVDFWGEWEGKKHQSDEHRCKRVEGSRWCGAPSDIEKGGCFEEWKRFQQGKGLNVEKWGNGQVIVRSKESQSTTMDLKLNCEGEKLVVQQCFLDKNVGLQAGRYRRRYSFFFGCPANQPFTAEQLEAAAVIVKAPDSGDLPSQLKSFKPVLPAAIDESCAKEWEILTSNGLRKVDDDAFVEIVEQHTITSDYDQDIGYHPLETIKVHTTDGLWAKFTCDSQGGVLKLKECRRGKKRDGVIPRGKFRKVDGDFFNCGDGDGNADKNNSKKTEASRVATLVTRTTEKVKGLTEA